MKKALKWIVIGFVGLAVVGALIPSEDKDKVAPAKAQAVEQTPDKPEPTPKPEPTTKPEPKPQPKPEPPAEPAEPEMTSAQENAVASAQDYLDTSGFSAKSLTEQLTFEDYSQADATYAVDHVGADWNAEAVESAQSYLDMSSFSAQGLTEQLTFEGYTPEQAQHAVSQVY